MNPIVIGVIALVVGILIVLVASAGLLNVMHRRVDDEYDDENESRQWHEPEPVPEVKAAWPERADAELIAVIAAVLAAELNTSADRLVVRSVRRVSQWNGLAREGR